MKLRLLAALAVFVSACTSPAVQDKAPSAAATPSAPCGPKAEIGTFGLDLAAGNPAVKAGDDFFAHANGKWYDSYTIPDDRSSYGIFSRLDELSQDRQREI